MANTIFLTQLPLSFNFWSWDLKLMKLKRRLIGFTGAERRFEQVYFQNNIYLFDDYAHHPAEIEATINAAKAPI